MTSEIPKFVACLCRSRTLQGELLWNRAERYNRRMPQSAQFIFVLQLVWAPTIPFTCALQPAIGSGCHWRTRIFDFPRYDCLYLMCLLPLRPVP